MAASAEHQELLGKDITKSELYEALKHMKKTSAPGMDGFTVPFYLVFWDKLADTYLQALNFAFKEGIMTVSQCRGILRLLPKKDKQLVYVKNWRPITLLNVDYKILTKALGMRLRVALPALIHRDQRGFVKDRYIGDNVFELYSLISQAELDDEEGILLQLDIEKAFDSVSWYYLEQVMEMYFLPASFIHWIRTIYKRKEIHIANNGHLSQPIYPTNGLAQGDGLSPLLFVLVMESLAATIRENDAIQGFKIGSIHKKLALLADDMMLSLKAKQSTFREVLNMLIDFAKISNLSVNADKTAVFPIGSIAPINERIDISPFKWSSEPTCQYLGISVPIRIQSISKCRSSQPAVATIIEHAKSVLLPRNTRDYFLYGRILNVKAFIGAKLNYYFALAVSPTDTVLKKVQSKLNDYVWSYGLHHVEAKLLYRPYDVGGLQMYNVIDHARSSKLKALNKLCSADTVDGKEEKEFWRAQIQACLHIPLKLLPKVNFSV